MSSKVKIQKSITSVENRTIKKYYLYSFYLSFRTRLASVGLAAFLLPFPFMNTCFSYTS